MKLSKANVVLAFLLLFSVCLNFGLMQSFFNRPRAGEKTLQVSHDGKQLTLTIGDGQSFPVSVVMDSDQARTLVRSVNEQAEETASTNCRASTNRPKDAG